MPDVITPTGNASPDSPPDQPPISGPGHRDLPLPDTPTEPDGDASGDDTPSVFDRVRDLTGKDFSSKYQTEEELIRGLVSAQERLSQRDSDASSWQELLKSIPPDRKGEFLQIVDRLQRNEPLAHEPEPAPAPADSPPGHWKSYSEYEAARASIYDANGQIRPNADPRLVAAVRDTEQKMFEALFNHARKPEDPNENPLAKRIEELEEYIRTQSEKAQAEQANAAMQAVFKKHADALFVDGDMDKRETTAFGEKVRAKLQARRERGLQTTPEDVELVIAATRAEYPPPQDTRPVDSRARPHTPAAPAPKALDPEDFFRKGGSLLDWVKKQGYQLKDGL